MDEPRLTNLFKSCAQPVQRSHSTFTSLQFGRNRPCHPQGVGHDRERGADAQRRRKDTAVRDKGVGPSKKSTVRFGDGVVRGTAKPERPALMRDVLFRRKRAFDGDPCTGHSQDLGHPCAQMPSAIEIVLIEGMADRHPTILVQKHAIRRVGQVLDDPGQRQQMPAEYPPSSTRQPDRCGLGE